MKGIMKSLESMTNALNWNSTPKWLSPSMSIMSIMTMPSTIGKTGYGMERRTAYMR